MRLATTIGEMLDYCNHNAADTVRAYEGTGFRHLDYSFYRVIREGSSFMGDRWMDEIHAAAEAAAKCGFDFVQAHAPGNNPFAQDADLDAIILGVERSIAACGYLGIPNIVLHHGFAPEMRYPDDQDTFFARNRVFFERLYPAMERNQVRVLIENSASANMGGIYYLMTGQEMKDFLAYCNHPLLGACWDVGHANLQNPDQYGDIVTLGEDLRAVHIADNLGRTDDHMAPFMGTLDIDAVMRGLFDSGFVDRGGYFTFEADNLISRAGSWPSSRNAKFPDGKCASPSLELRRASIRFLYEIGKSILTAYDCFEE